MRVDGRSLARPPARGRRPARHRARPRGPPHLRRADRRGEPAARARGPAASGGNGDDLDAGVRALPDRREFRAAARRGALGRPAAAAGDRPGARSPSPTCCCSTSRRSASRRRSSTSSSRRSAQIREAGVAVLLVEQRAQRTIALADRTLRARQRRAAPHARPARTRATPTGSSPPTSHDARVPQPLWPDARRRDRARQRSTPSMAVGIGLVFGVLRLVNFAYGELIRPAPTRSPTRRSGSCRTGRRSSSASASCSRCRSLMERVVFRPLRGASPAMMLVATFAVAFVLQASRCIAFGSRGKIAGVLGDLNRPLTIVGARTSARSRSSRSSAAPCCLAGLQLLLNADDGRAAHARRRRGLPRRPAARRARRPGDQRAPS